MRYSMEEAPASTFAVPTLLIGDDAITGLANTIMQATAVEAVINQNVRQFVDLGIGIIALNPEKSCCRNGAFEKCLFHSSIDNPS